MSIALYRQYRPQKFGEVEGQSSAVDVLIKSISAGRSAHAYLFSGARGCGKTTVARLTAKALNCASPADNYEPCCECQNCTSIANGENLDVIEIDGASNNGVEEIRELKNHVSLAPFNSRFKVYIIDEVHMLSTAAFNALLKTLEEPPDYVVFILATTEPHKIPVTIRSRCQHIPFHRIRSTDILHRLEFVCKKENLEYEDEALWEIARQADGALRDALSLLDQVMSLGKGKIILEDVSALAGGGSLPALQRWLSAWRIGGEESFLLLNDMFRRGASTQRVIEELFYISRNLWIASTFGYECLSGADISKEEYDFIVEECKLWSSDSLERLMLFLAKLLPQVRIGMRADVVVGVLLSRRPEIISNETKHVTPVDKVRSAKAVVHPAVAVSTSKTINSENNETKEITPVDKDISVKAVVHPAEPSLYPYDPNDLLEEGFKPLDDGIRHEFLLSLKSSDFALFCALLDSEFHYSLEQNKVCVITKHDYLFHFLSSGRNSLIFIKTVRVKFPDCKLKIVCERKSYEYGETNKVKQAVNSIEDVSNDIAEKTQPEASTEKLEVSQGTNVREAAYNSMEFMRGEIVMYHAAKDKTDELENI